LQNPDSIPLICGLDGVLLKTDHRSERLLHNTRNWLERVLSSRLDLKRLQFEQNDRNTVGAVLPLNEEVRDFLLEEKSRGRHLILDSNESPAAIASLSHDLQMFDETVALNGNTTPGYEQFDYIGGAATPQSIWSHAIKRYTVGPVSGVQPDRTFSTSKAGIKSWVKAIRAYQWLKNLLVFVPLITSQQLTSAGAVSQATIMFVCFSLIASFGYIVNDLLDLQSDRAHPIKKQRAFASGVLSARAGITAGIVLLAMAALLSLLLPPMCALVLISYLLLTILYSTYLKTKLMIDVVALGGLFTLRVIGGAAAIETDLSFYLLGFSIFLFSSLGMVKRFAELHNLKTRNKFAARGRGYRVEDMEPVRIIGISLGYMSVFIMGLYINSPVVTEYYDNPKFIWFLLPLLTYWLGRLWILANRGEVNEDPLIFTVKDRTSLLICFLSSATLLIAN